MRVLAIDSAGAGCSACVWQDGRVLAAKSEGMERGQDQRLMPLILDVMKQAAVAFAALDRIAVTRGPGSFTGLRIGLAAAHGIGLAASKPVVGIDRFAIYRELFPEGNLLVVLESKRKELYCRLYPASDATHEPGMMTREEIDAFLAMNKDTTIAGDIPSRGEKEIITCAALAARADTKNPAFLPRPLYLRAPDVTLSLKFEPTNISYVPLLTELHGESFGAAAWNLEQMQGSLALATTQGWIARQNGEAVGFILCQMAEDQSEILTFCVRPALRRHGVGEKLLRHALKSGEKVFLEVAADNIAACKLYEKAGFHITGKRTGYYKRGTSSVDALAFSLVNADRIAKKG